jgi:hypothetical protein
MRLAACIRLLVRLATRCADESTWVAHGSRFALVVGDKVYTLETSDKTALATLDQQAGKTASVTGTLNDDTIEVSSVIAK